MGVCWYSCPSWWSLAIQPGLDALVERLNLLLVYVCCSLVAMIVHVSYDRRIRVSVHQLVINWHLCALLCTGSCFVDLPLEWILWYLSHALAYYLCVYPLGILGFYVGMGIILVLAPLDPLIYRLSTILVQALLDRVEVYRIFLIMELIQLHFQAVSCDRTIQWH